MQMFGLSLQTCGFTYLLLKGTGQAFELPHLLWLRPFRKPISKSAVKKDCSLPWTFESQGTKIPPSLLERDTNSKSKTCKVHQSSVPFHKSVRPKSVPPFLSFSARQGSQAWVASASSWLPSTNRTCVPYLSAKTGTNMQMEEDTKGLRGLGLLDLHQVGRDGICTYNRHSLDKYDGFHENHDYHAFMQLDLPVFSSWFLPLYVNAQKLPCIQRSCMHDSCCKRQAWPRHACQPSKSQGYAYFFIEIRTDGDSQEQRRPSCTRLPIQVPRHIGLTTWTMPRSLHTELNFSCLLSSHAGVRWLWKVHAARDCGAEGSQCKQVVAIIRVCVYVFLHAYYCVCVCVCVCVMHTLVRIHINIFTHEHFLRTFIRIRTSIHTWILCMHIRTYEHT
jgi:hypothetical protein